MLAAFFDRYRKAFESRDVEGLAALVHLPCLTVSGPTLVAVTEPDELRRRLERQFARHKEAGLASTRCEVIGHRRLDPRFTTADLRWEFLREDGSVITQFGVAYTLTAPEHGWKVATVLPLDLSPAH